MWEYMVFIVHYSVFKEGRGKIGSQENEQTAPIPEHLH